MVVYRIHSEKLQQLIKSLRGITLKTRVRITVVPHAVYDIVAFPVLADKRIQHFDIILQIRIHRDRYVAHVLCRHQPRKERVLVAPVS